MCVVCKNLRTYIHILHATYAYCQESIILYKNAKASTIGVTNANNEPESQYKNI